MTKIDAITGTAKAAQPKKQSEKAKKTNLEPVGLLWEIKEEMEASQKKAKVVEVSKKEEKTGIFMTAIGKGWLWGKEDKTESTSTKKEIKPTEDKTKKDEPQSLLWDLQEEFKATQKNINDIKEAAKEEKVQTKNIEENPNIDKKDSTFETVQQKPQNIDQEKTNTSEVSKKEEKTGIFMAAIGKGWLWGKEDKTEVVDSSKENKIPENSNTEDLKTKEPKQETIVQQEIIQPKFEPDEDKIINEEPQFNADEEDVTSQAQSNGEDSETTYNSEFSEGELKDVKNAIEELSKMDDEEASMDKVNSSVTPENNQMDAVENTDEFDEIDAQRNILLDKIGNATNEEERAKLVNEFYSLDEKPQTQNPEEAPKKVVPTDNNTSVTNVVNVAEKPKPKKVEVQKIKQPQENRIEDVPPKIKTPPKASVDYKALSDEQLFDACEKALEENNEKEHRKILEEIQKRLAK